MSKQYDFSVFIGRFQPFHNGHKKVIEKALEISNKVIILVGSANSSRSVRNPFTFNERAKMIMDTINNPNILITPILDFAYNDDLWVTNVQSTVQGLTCQYQITSRPRICLIGHKKDKTSFYLKLFPQWHFYNVDSFDDINSTDIRSEYFNNPMTFNFNKVPNEVRNFLMQYSYSCDYEYIMEEMSFIKKYREIWNNTPFPVIFSTVDALVYQSGHILLVERKGHPGKGQLALPGGFVNENERLIDAAIRELKEETRLKVPIPVLLGSLKSNRVFDDPNRSSRGRIITNAFYFRLKDDIELPKVKGSSDAKNANWYSIGELNPSNFFEDHYAMIQVMLNLNQQGIVHAVNSKEIGK